LKNANYDKGMIDEEIAHCYYSLNNFVKASEYFRAAIKAQPNEARNYYNVGLSIYYDTSEKINSDSVYNEAFIYFKRACELNPADPKYHYFKGYALLYTDRDREAMQYVKKAISIDSTDYDYWDTYNRLCIGDCSNKEKRKIAREGINCFKALIKKDTSNASFYYALGRNYEWYKEDLSGNSYSKYVDSARICFKIAWALDTSKGIYLEEYLGYLEIKDEWVKKMVNDFLKRHPENIEVSRILFWDAYWEKDYKTANDLYFNMNTFAPQDWATKQINDAVKELKNKYSWSDICERKPCYYMYEH
jgi:tetratricopeptide (TPR) repeat protein